MFYLNVQKQGEHPKFFSNQMFGIFTYSQKTQKKKIFETNLSVIGLSRAHGMWKSENAKYGQKSKKGPIFNIFQKFQIYVNSYPILSQNSKFGGPRVKNVDFRAKNWFLGF